MSKGKCHTKHHYVPQVYLKQFAHSNGKVKNPTFYLNVYNINLGKHYHKNVEDVCQIPNFYTISDTYLKDNPDESLTPLSIEIEHFANNIECDLKFIIEEVRLKKLSCISENAKIFPMQKNDKYLLARQIVTQYLRHPDMREYDNSFFDDFYPKMIRLFKEGYAMETKNPDFLKLDIGIQKDEVVHHAQFSYLNEELISKFAQDLSEDSWTFLYSPNFLFMTSDTPLVCAQQYPNELPLNLGLHQKGSIKFFALSPDLLLMMTDENIQNFDDCNFTLAINSDIKLYNAVLFSQSKELYSFNEFEN